MLYIFQFERFISNQYLNQTIFYIVRRSFNEKNNFLKYINMEKISRRYILLYVNLKSVIPANINAELEYTYQVLVITIYDFVETI